MTSPFDAKRLTALWLMRLRWVAVVGQLATIAFVEWGFFVQLPNVFLLTIVATTAFSNALFALIIYGKPHPPPARDVNLDLVMGLVSVMDMLSLTALLYATGGVTNPFWTFFFVNLCLSSVVLLPAWAWAINGLAIVCFGFLLFDYRPLAILEIGIQLEPVRWTGRWSLNQIGLWAAFAACASVIVYFLTRLTSSLRIQERDLRRAEQIQSDSEKLDALATLAAGTAHELATPLSTIAVVAREVEKAFEKRSGQSAGEDDLVSDIHLIRSELDRCRKILDRMASQSGQTVGEVVRRVHWKRVWQEVIDSLAAHDRVQLQTDLDMESSFLVVPVAGFAQAIRGLIQNGIDASPTGDPIVVRIERQQRFWNCTIADGGVGMSAETLKRISQPFFTTKPVGKGMGLGVFLARSLVRRLGGELQFDSTAGRGTRVSLRVPLAEDQTAEPAS